MGGIRGTIMRADMPEPLFTCEYVKLQAKLNDGQRFEWSQWVPNQAVDTLLGMAGVDTSTYPPADDFAKEQARFYMRNGIRVIWDAGGEELVPPNRILELTTSVEKLNLTIAEIFMPEAHLHDKRSEVTVMPPRKRPSVQEFVDVMDRFMNGTATLNELFARVRQPARPETEANAFLWPTEAGYVKIADGQPVNLRPLFSNDVLFGIVEIRRAQVLQGVT